MKKSYQLIFITTYKCNLRCCYCKTVKCNKTISIQTMKRAIDLMPRVKTIQKIYIKFFGGEPLLSFPGIKRFITYLKKNKPALFQKAVFFLSTNGILLNDKMLEWFLENRFDVSISIDGEYYHHSKNRTGNARVMRRAYDFIMALPCVMKRKITINMVVRPESAKILYGQFLFLVERGFVRFNFLPEAFVWWPIAAQKELLLNLVRVAKYCKRNRQIVLKNKNINNRMFFFNSGIVVDCDGSIYFNNAIMFKNFRHLAPQMMAGNVYKLQSFKELFKEYGKNVALRKNYYRAQQYIIRHSASNRKIDEILDMFVRASN